MSTEQTPETTPAAPESPIRNPLRDARLEAKEVPEVLDFLRENGTSILIGVGLAVVIFLGYSAFRNYRRSQEITASSQLFNSRAAEQFQQLASQYTGTSAAPLAQLALAGQYFDEGQYELAQNAFTEFLQRHPGHAFETTAVLGNVQCLEALERYDEARAGYEAFLKDHPKHYLEVTALLGQGRCLEQLGRLEDARALYEDYQTANPEGRWEGRVDAALRFAEKAMRARDQGAAVSAAPATPAAPEPILTIPAPQPAAQDLPPAGP